MCGCMGVVLCIKGRGEGPSGITGGVWMAIFCMELFQEWCSLFLLDNMYLGTGRHPMAPLPACQTLVSIMHIEQGRGSHHHGIWRLGMCVPWLILKDQ